MSNCTGKSCDFGCLGWVMLAIIAWSVFYVHDVVMRLDKKIDKLSPAKIEQAAEKSK